MKKIIYIWLVGFILLTTVGICLLVKGYSIEVPEMGASNWFELSKEKDNFVFWGIGSLIMGNIAYLVICIVAFSICVRFNPKLRAQVSKKMTSIEKNYQDEVDSQTYQNMQDVSDWRMGVHEKAINRMSSSFHKHGQNNTSEVIKVKCQSCGALNDENAFYCNKCGRKL